VKIQKGVLGQTTPEPNVAATEHVAKVEVQPPRPVVVDKDRLFETLDKEKESTRSYAKLLVLAVIAVIGIGVAIFYFTLPKPGDVVRAPAGLEQAVRDHLLEKQKRTATDIVFYYCGTDTYCGRSGVETRNDLPNPVFRLATYQVAAHRQGDGWDISSKPVQSADDDVPCR
jgi:hypothetical protein